MKSPRGVAIYAGILLAVTMFLNVWLVIWPNQKKVIANARNVQAGGRGRSDGGAGGTQGALASRMNTIFSLPMLVFMVGTSHFPYDSGVDTSGSKRATFWIIWVVIWGVLELNLRSASSAERRPGGPRDHLRHPSQRDHHGVRVLGRRADCSSRTS